MHDKVTCRKEPVSMEQETTREVTGDALPTHPSFWAVIPAGGSGTRLWPLSRSTRPKYLLSLFGDESLLQQTFARLRRITVAERILVICGPAHADAIRQQLPDLPIDNIVVEPTPNGTGPALALAAGLIASRDRLAVMGSFHADHDVTDPDAFVDAVSTAIAAAADGSLVTIGLTPSRPETGYGYIERSTDVVARTETGTAWRAERFVEKPDLETATQYVESGRFLWNAGMFVWKVSSLFQELERQQPRIADGVRRIVDLWGDARASADIPQIWGGIPNESIDNGVMEHARRVSVVPADMGWSDVGDFHSLGELIEHDGLGNSVRGEFIQLETRNSVIWSETGRPVVTLGLDNMIVVDTHDALLVIERSKSQDVKRLVDELRRTIHRELS
jgi:mannose-1-phosphate guanylyltransferase